MLKVHHINCGWLQPPGYPRVPCHCLLIESADRLALVDSGIGLLDCRDPDERIGPELIELAGFRFGEDDTAIRQVERLGFRPSDVAEIVLTHGDPDHAGGLADFPNARVHVAAEEHAAIVAGAVRYRAPQFAHEPRWVVAPPSDQRWFGLEARPLPIGQAGDAWLVPLFGHTLGNSGVAIRRGDDRWLLHVGDAYYLRVELTTDDHPVSALAAQRAVDDVQRRASIEALRRLKRDHDDIIEMFGYHDISEFP